MGLEYVLYPGEEPSTVQNLNLYLGMPLDAIGSVAHYKSI